MEVYTIRKEETNNNKELGGIMSATQLQ